MTYSNKFVLCILRNGHPQKELANGTVSLPFGAEYSLRLRNKNDRRAVVKIFVDGENVSGGGYVINACDYVDIKRHHDKDRAFKFVSLDSEDAIDFGKDGPNQDKVKGTIEARFYLEKKRPEVIYRDVHHDHHHHHHDHYIPSPPRPVNPWPYSNPSPIWTTKGGESVTYGDNAVYGSSDMSLDADLPAGHMNCASGGGTTSGLGPLKKPCGGQTRRRGRGRGRGRGMKYGACGSSGSIQSALPIQTSSFAPEPLQDGCTVEGYSTGQNFHSTYCDTEDTFTSLKIFLQGHSDSDEAVEVVEPRPHHRPTNKDCHIDDLEAENERLRQELAEKENKALKEKLEQLDE